MHHPFNSRSIAALCTAVLSALAAVAHDDHDHATTEPDGRKPAAIMSYLGADWLERSDRDEEQQPEKVIAAMELKPGMNVADIGSGSGYFTWRLARAVAPEGKVYAVDVQPEMNELLDKRLKEAGIDNVETILGTDEDPKLPPASIDWIQLVDTYHEFQKPQAMLAKMRAALKPGGKVALLEYRLDGDTASHIKADHRMSVRQVLSEWNQAGFILVDLLEFLPSQHFFVFEARPDCPEK